MGIVAAQPGVRTLKAELSPTSDGRLEFTLLDRAPEEGRTLFIDQDITLTTTSAQKLGYRKVIIKHGEYSFSENKSVLNAKLTR